MERPRAEWTAPDLAALRVLAAEIGRGEKRVDEAFPKPEVSAGVSADEITGQP